MKKCLRNMSLVALNVYKEGLKGNAALVIRLQLLEFGQAKKAYCTTRRTDKTLMERMFIEVIII